MHRPVVVGLDASAESMAAAHWAARESLLRGLPLQLVHAWGWHPLLPAPLDVEAAIRAERTLRAAETALLTAWPGLDLTAERTTRPADAALLVRAEAAEMLVLGSSGRGVVAGFLLGSVGQQILSRATCPVVMVRADAADDDAQETGEVVVGLRELDRSAGPLLRFAVSAAEARKTSVRVLHTWNVPPEIRHDGDALRVVDEDGTMAGRAEEALAATVGAWQDGSAPRMLRRVVRGSPGEVLIQAARGAALIVVGRRVRHTRLGPHIGPVAHAVLHHVAAPVAVVPHD